jgi:hypothetical protein
LDQLVDVFLVTLANSVGPILVAVISGYFLLRSHHSKLRAELFYTRKQAAYDSIAALLNDFHDHSQRLLDEINWLKVRWAQTSHLLVGSRKVVDIFNALVRIYMTKPVTEEESKKQDEEITKLRKQLWNVMRKDLYGAKGLPLEAITFWGPSTKTTQALETWGRHMPLLEKERIEGLDALNRMDIVGVSRKTTVPSRDLEELKSMANRELRLRREFREANQIG